MPHRYTKLQGHRGMIREARPASHHLQASRGHQCRQLKQLFNVHMQVIQPRPADWLGWHRTAVLPDYLEHSVSVAMAENFRHRILHQIPCNPPLRSSVLLPHSCIST